MTGLSGPSVTTRAAALLSGLAMLAALAALPAGPALASPAGPARLATPPRAGTTSGTTGGGTTSGGTTGGKAGSHGRAGQAAARPGTNLLLNPGAQTGAVSARGWDSVTIPGWQVVSGLPTAVRYGTPRFPPATGRWPLVPGGQLFAGGAGGTARLRQSVSLRRSESAMRYDLSAWLGGTSHSSATVTVAFLSATGQVLGRGTTGPVGKGTGGHRLSPRAATGTVPAGAVSARVTLVLATTLTNIDGPYAPKVGYDWALADGLRFSVSAPVRRPPPRRRAGRGTRRRSW
jgi:hypothetical protein